MKRNISTACKKNQVVSWFQLTLAAGHTQISDLCSNFIKANFELVAKTIDFPNMEAEVLVDLMKCNDLVVFDEFKLFECIALWLKAKQKIIMVDGGEENEKVCDIYNIFDHTKSWFFGAHFRLFDTLGVEKYAKNDGEKLKYYYKQFSEHISH